MFEHVTIALLCATTAIGCVATNEPPEATERIVDSGNDCGPTVETRLPGQQGPESVVTLCNACSDECGDGVTACERYGDRCASGVCVACCNGKRGVLVCDDSM